MAKRAGGRGAELQEGSMADYEAKQAEIKMKEVEKEKERKLKI